MITIHNNSLPIYNIYFSSSYDQMTDMLKELNLENRKVCIVSDTNVASYHMDSLTCILEQHCKKVTSFIFKAGEVSKNLDTVSDLYETLIASKFDRGDYLFALGGGVVGDLTGFAAATYLRGISFVQVPTSLLAMVDSSVGGKTGVDFKSYKNMVGAFYQPKAVYMNFSLLKTLNEKEFYSGFGEIIKHGLIQNLDYYKHLQNTAKELNGDDLDLLGEVIIESCKIKQSVVEVDAKENGLRAILNFGHTIGHAFEKIISERYLHGECVSLGIVAASYISYKRNYISNEEFNGIKSCLQAFHLPIELLEELSAQELYDISLNDKKMLGGKIKFILIKRIGEAYIDTTVTKEEMIESIKYVLGEIK